jgi:hypothetical protein
MRADLQKGLDRLESLDRQRCGAVGSDVSIEVTV